MKKNRQLENIIVHIDQLATDSMRKHACADAKEHPIDFQVFRFLCGYEEALSEIKSLEEEREGLKKIADELSEDIEDADAEIESLREDRDLWKKSEHECNEYSKELLGQIETLKAKIERKDMVLKVINDFRYETDSQDAKILSGWAEQELSRNMEVEG